jgi:hypothetical protein
LCFGTVFPKKLELVDNGVLFVYEGKGVIVHRCGPAMDAVKIAPLVRVIIVLTH